MTQRGGWGEGTLTDLGGGKWKFRLPLYLGRGQSTFEARNKTEAKKQARQLVDAAAAALREPVRPRVPTFDESCEYTLGGYTDKATLRKMVVGLRTARKAFGHMPLDELTYDILHGWERDLRRGTLSDWTVHSYLTSVSTVLNHAVRRGLIRESPARHLKNPVPRPSLIEPFETLNEVMEVAGELPVALQAVPPFACLTGLRIEEWVALERADIQGGQVRVNKRFTDGMLKPGTKNRDPERIVPLHPLAAEALRSHPPRLDSLLLFPAPDGGHLNVDGNYMRSAWNTAFKASGVKRRRMKDMRHTFATWQLTGNCNVWHLSKVMGTAVKNLERTYGRWIPGSESVVLAAMDNFVARETAAK